MRKMIFGCCLFVILSFVSSTANGEIVLTSRSDAKKYSVVQRQDAFSFIIFGDVKNGSAAGLEVLKKAVSETNILDPDFVFTVGDLVDGYNVQHYWLRQMKEVRSIMDGLNMPWFAVAGNHDIYWKGPGRPAGGHRDDFERHFGPVWYAYKHKDCWFIALYTDEGDPVTGEQGFRKPEQQLMSDGQKSWLKMILDKAKDDKHVFVFMHHPRWKKGVYGDDWDNIHEMLKSAGNVSAVFAGHYHDLQYEGVRDGITYYVLGTTGGSISKERRRNGGVHHVAMVKVRGSKFNLSVIPVGKIINPMDQQFLREPLLTKRWQIKSQEERSLEFKVKIEKTSMLDEWLIVGIGHGGDDSGDYGMHYRLFDAEGKMIDRQFVWHEGIDRFEYKIKESGEYTIKLQDRDTDFEGKHPGNSGTIEVIHRKTKAAN